MLPAPFGRTGASGDNALADLEPIIARAAVGRHARRERCVRRTRILPGHSPPCFEFAVKLRRGTRFSRRPGRLHGTAEAKGGDRVCERLRSKNRRSTTLPFPRRVSRSDVGTTGLDGVIRAAMPDVSWGTSMPRSERLTRTAGQLLRSNFDLTPPLPASDPQRQTANATCAAGSPENGQRCRPRRCGRSDSPMLTSSQPAAAAASAKRTIASAG